MRHHLHRLSIAAVVTTLALVAQPLVAQEAAPTVSSVTVVEGNDNTELLLVVDGSITADAVSSFAQAPPDEAAIVVDIAGGDLSGVKPKTSGSGIVDRISAEETDTGARVTFYLTRETPEYFLDVADGQIVLTLTGVATPDPGTVATGASGSAPGALVDQDNRGRQAGAVSGPEGTGTTALASLDYENLDTVARVVVGLNADIDYVSSQPERMLVVIDLPGATLPASMGRVLDTSEFISPVKMVRAYKTSTGVRVAVTLTRADTQWEVRQGPDNLVYLDVAVPLDMQEDRQLSQSMTVVAPSGPSSNASDPGLESYGSEEILIGQAGRTSSPSTAMGSGRGGAGDALAGTAFGFMQDMSDASDIPFSGRRINIDLVDADIHSVFRLISHVANLNIVAGDDVQGTVTVRLEDVPWDQALAAVLQSKGLGAQRFGNIVRIAPIETIKAEQQAALEAQQAKEQLTPLQVLVVPLNYASVEEVLPQIQGLITERGSVEADARSNQLIIKETADRLAQIRELLRHIDQSTPQVLIEARVVEASATYVNQFGVQWGGQLDASANTGYGTGLFFPNAIGVSGGKTQGTQGVTQLFFEPNSDNLAVDLAPAGDPTGSLAVSMGSIPGLINIDARLAAMETDGHGEIVSAPRVTTLDNQEAQIKQGARIPYLSVSAAGTQVQFIQAALELKVTPHITSDEKIFMQLAVSNNRPDFGSAIQGQPAIQVKEVTTQVLVDDGDTMVIGGVFATEESTSSESVPLLSRIPLLGYLFRNNNFNSSRNEMLVFVTPSIITEAQ
jgi:type IV pilus assembly protein PilQ